MQNLCSSFPIFIDFQVPSQLIFNFFYFPCCKSKHLARHYIKLALIDGDRSRLRISQHPPHLIWRHIYICMIMRSSVPAMGSTMQNRFLRGKNKGKNNGRNKRREIYKLCLHFCAIIYLCAGAAPRRLANQSSLNALTV